MACVLDSLLCNPNQNTRLAVIAFSLHITDSPLFLLNVVEICKMSLLDPFLQLSLQRCCSNTELTAVVVSRGSPEVLFGPWSESWFRCHSSEVKPGMPHQCLKTSERGRGGDDSPHVPKEVQRYNNNNDGNRDCNGFFVNKPSDKI